MVELKIESMLFDVVQEVRAQVETLVPSRLKRVEGDAEEMKRGSKALGDDAKERQAKLEQYALDSSLDAAGHANRLKEWTGKTRATIIYNSKVDPFTADGLFNKVKDKPNIAVIGFTTDGDVFGGFFSVAVRQQDKFFEDPNMFIFSLESQGRCMTPQRFVVKREQKENALVCFSKGNRFGFVWFEVNNAGFWLGNEKSDSFCSDLSRGFEGLEDTTQTGKTGIRTEGEYHCTHLVAIQLG